MAESNYRAKGRQHIISNKKSPTIATPRYKQTFDIAYPEDPKKPISQKKLTYIADVMVEWVKSSNELYCFNTFLYYQNMTLSTFIRWIPKSKTLEDAYNFTMQVLGTNRELAALAKNAEGLAFKTMQYTYDKQWKEAEERQVKLKIANDKEGLSKDDFVSIIGRILRDPNEKHTDE